MSGFRILHWSVLVLTSCCILLAISAHDAESNGTSKMRASPFTRACVEWFRTHESGVMSRTDPKCTTYTWENVYHNLPILDGVYCFNNGTGICKAFSGRFEFVFNVWTQEFLGPVSESNDVDIHGYHRRVPHSYTPEGRVLYADRAINWSREFTKNKGAAYNLLSATSFNWCEYAITNNWPYKSSILDHDKVHLIYFFNRQTCIYDTQTKEVQHYNTRFLHTSVFPIDLDYNPTIFAMEDNTVNEVRLVKHKRQHWHEASWKLLKHPKKDVKHFIEMNDIGHSGGVVNGRGALLRAQMYKRFTDMCINDFMLLRYKLVTSEIEPGCGFDQAEIALHMSLKISTDKTTFAVYDVGLHSIPDSKETQQFYGANLTWNGDSGSDGYSFSATTTIPHGKNTFEVISLLSYYKGNRSTDSYDVHYPPTYLLRYNMTYSQNNGGHEWTGIENRNISGAAPLLNLNYVDDIAYLPECNTILVIFGPLYTEFPVDEFNMDKRTPLGSIYDLGANEMIEAFFAVGDKLYFYHRLNYVAEHTYTCGGGGGKSRADGDSSPLVTATRNGPYKFRNGPGRFPFMPSRNDLYNHYEERHFQLTGLFKGDIGAPEAPDASKFTGAQNLDLSTSLYWYIGLFVLGLLLTLIVGCFVLRTRTKRALRAPRSAMGTTRSSNFVSATPVSPSKSRSGSTSGRRKAQSPRSPLSEVK